jgi:cadmium resistance protein CadD (predicted permease)
VAPLADMDRVAALGLAIGIFATTKLDDVFVLFGLFSDLKFKTRQVAVGPLLSIATLKR